MNSEQDPTTFFSHSYDEARKKFIDEARRAGFAHTSHKVPEVAGPENEELTMDVAVSGPNNASRGLLLISATHGVEGFCGSGCQIGFLRSDDLVEATRHMRVVLVHGLNPYGFAWLRRVNEDNVDLNRNFRDHSLPPPLNEGYEALADAIAPRDVSPEALAKADERFLSFGKTHGFDALQQAISGGQYHHSDGLYFGGRRATWSNKTFCEISAITLADVRLLSAIDFHSGLGPFGYAELISTQDPNSAPFRRAQTWWDDRVTSTKDGSSISADLEGTLASAMPQILPNTKVVFICVEYGTVDPMDVLSATRDDNWLYRSGDLNGEQAESIRQRMLNAYYPDSDEWKQKVWNQADEIIRKAIDGLERDG